MKRDTGSLKALQSRKTKAALVKSASRLFGLVGFQKAGLSDIAQGADVSTGAIYHNFGGKEELFRCVHLDVAEALFATVRQESAQQVPNSERQGIERAQLALRLVFAELQRDSVRRILLEDGPAVLGTTVSREQFHERGIEQLEAGLLVLMTAEVIAKQPARLLASMVFGALMEAAHPAVGGSAKEFEAIVRAMIGWSD